MAKTISDLSKLSLDCYNGVNIKFNEVKGEDAIRNAITAIVGTDFAKGYRRNKAEFFELLEELLTLPVGGDIEGMFGNLVGEERVGLADSYNITVPDNALLKVAKVSAGNSDIRRQRIYDKTITVTAFDLEIKIYEELNKFLAGKINWTQFVDTAKKSLVRRIEEEIHSAFASSFSLLNASYGITGTLTDTKLAEQIAKVKAKTGMEVAVYGSPVALQKISNVQITTAPSVISDSQKEAYAKMRHFGNFGATPLIELPQVFATGTETFVVDDSTLFILPVATELIKVVYFGGVWFDEDTEGKKRNDRQIEFIMTQKMGLAVLLINYYSIYKIS